MTAENQLKLTRNAAKLAQGMKVEDILPELVSAGILTADERERILSYHTQRDRTVHFLLEIFIAKPNWAFEKLVSILNDNGKEQYAQLLQDEG